MYNYSSFLKTAQACLKNDPGRFAPSALPHYKHTLPRLARSTVKELQQKQHEKASLVCVRVQSPSGLTLVPCALSMIDLSGQLRCRITQNIPGTENAFIFYFWHPTYARTTRYEEAFLLKAKSGLGRFAPSALLHYQSTWYQVYSTRYIFGFFLPWRLTSMTRPKLYR